jgi:hypothetical protein
MDKSCKSERKKWESLRGWRCGISGKGCESEWKIG